MFHVVTVYFCLLPFFVCMGVLAYCSQRLRLSLECMLYRLSGGKYQDNFSKM